MAAFLTHASRPQCLRTTWLAAAGLLAVLATGCAPRDDRPLTATALRPYGQAELQVGDDFREFAFATATGQYTRLSAVRGRVTILAFPDDPAWPNCDLHARLAELAASESRWLVEVTVVSVGCPDGPCDAALGAGLACNIKMPRLILVCDPHARVHELYGVAARGHYYLLTNFLRIASIGPLDDLDGLRAATRKLVRETYDQDEREGLHDKYIPEGGGRF